MVNPNQQAESAPQHNLYTIDVDCGQNYYNYRGFGHITKNYRS